MTYETLTHKTKEGLVTLQTEYLKKYPFAGYGTRFSKILFNEESQLFRSTVSRSTTCD